MSENIDIYEKQPWTVTPGSSWLPQIHPDCDLCKKHSTDTLDLSVCRASIFTAELLTQSHRTPCPKPVQVSNPAAGFICKEIEGLRRARGGFPTPNQCKQHKLLQKCKNLKKSIIGSPILWQSMSWLVSKSISSEINLYWVSRAYYRYYILINPGSLKEISTDCQQKIHQSNRTSSVLKKIHDLSLWVRLRDIPLCWAEPGKLLSWLLIANLAASLL